MNRDRRHYPKMTPEQRAALQDYQYKRMLEERRRHNFQYLTDEVYRDLEQKGYKQVLETWNESEARDKVSELRSSGNYARILCMTGKLRIKQYVVFTRSRVDKPG